jgi:thioredoxin 1
VDRAAGEIEKITGEEAFRTRVLESTEPVLVEFYADWCGWCHRQEPIVAELAGEFKGSMSFYKLDTDAHGEIAARYKVNGLPSLLIFKGGKVVKTVEGFCSKEALRGFLKQHRPYVS